MPRYFRATIKVLKSVDQNTTRLQFSLKNLSKKNLNIIINNTPFEGIQEPIFNVKFNTDLDIGYEGVLGYRQCTTILIKSKKEKKCVVDIASSYYIDKIGIYNFTYVDQFITCLNDNGSKHIKYSIGKIGCKYNLKHERTENYATIARKLDFEYRKELHYTFCSILLNKEYIFKPLGFSDDEIKVLNSCQDIAKKQILKTDQSLKLSLKNPNPKIQNIVQKWIGIKGTNNPLFLNLIKSIEKILERFDKKPPSFFNVLEKAPGGIAYRIPRQYVIYLRPLFWEIPDTGNFSKVSTIVHELSHLILDTKDEYGHDHDDTMDRAQRNAQNDAANAIKIAQNLEFFITEINF